MMSFKHTLEGWFDVKAQKNRYLLKLMRHKSKTRDP